MPLLIAFCAFTTVISCSISSLCVCLHLQNYRKPLQQRLIVRIILIIPIYSIVCFINLAGPRWLALVLEPFKEIYEAFILYMFYCLLTHLLGGERSIIVKASGRAPLHQPFPMSMLFGRNVDISDPESFLLVKRCILQYAWLKPLLCLLFGINHLIPSSPTFWLSFGFYINVIYNASVSLSLYSLALFWRCLYKDLEPFSPWGKFLCVKLILFASYWQGIILAILKYFGYFTESAFVIQNALLCFELVGFALGHWAAFNYKEFTIKHLGSSSRMVFLKAAADVFGGRDLVVDFKTTFREGAKLYNFKQFESVATSRQVTLDDSQTRLKKLNQGMRYYSDADGKVSTHWLGNGTKENADAGDGGNIVGRMANHAAFITANNTANADVSDTRSTISASTVSTAPLSLSPPSSISPPASTTKKKPKKLKAQLAQEKKVKHIRKATKEVYHIDEYETAEFLNKIGIPKNEFLSDNSLYIKAIRERPFGDENYPVKYDTFGYLYSRQFQQRRGYGSL